MKETKTCTVGQLIAVLRAWPEDTEVYRHDSVWGPEEIFGVEVDGFTERLTIG